MQGGSFIVACTLVKSFLVEWMLCMDVNYCIFLNITHNCLLMIPPALQVPPSYMVEQQ